MTPEELRASIPALETAVYLNTGASGPPPRPVIEATEACLEDQAYRAHSREGPYDYARDQYAQTREAVADLLGADESEIALTQSTTDGVNRIAEAVDFEPGDTVVRTDLEHAAGILPWQRLADREGVEVEVVGSDAGRVDPAALDDAVRGAKLVCLSAITWTHGTRLPVRRAVEAAREADTLVLVDAVQAPGQTAVDVTEWGADFVAGAGHKWLLGPWGAGFLYVREESTDALEPDQVGYRSVVDAGVPDYEFHPGARRLEVGTTSPAPYAGLRAAIDVIEDVGIDTIETRIEELTDRLKAGLGDRLRSPREFESGLVTFAVANPDDFVDRADGAGIKIRALPSGHVRASVHAFNTAADVDALLDLL